MNQRTESDQDNAETGADTTASWIEVVRKQIDSLRFGVVQIVVHDGRVVQIERTEKVRLNAPEADQPAGGQKTTQGNPPNKRRFA